MGYDEHFSPEVGPSTLIGLRTRFPNEAINFTDTELRTIWLRAADRIGRVTNLQYPGRSPKHRNAVYESCKDIMQEILHASQ